MKKKDIERRKKFILELLGDPIYKPMRLREIATLLRLSKEEKREPLTMCWTNFVMKEKYL